MDEVIESSPNGVRNLSYREYSQQKRFQRTNKIKELKERNLIQNRATRSTENSLSASADDLSSLGCSVIQNEPESETKSKSVNPVISKAESVFKTPPRKILAKPSTSAISDQKPAEKVLKLNFFGGIAGDDEDLFGSDDDQEDENSEDIRLTQTLEKKIYNSIKPVDHPPPNDDMFAAGRFIQAMVSKPRWSQVSNTQKFENMEISQLPPHLIDILDGKYPPVEVVKEEKSETKVDQEEELPDLGPLELFSDQIYGGLGEKFDQPKVKSPKFSSWTTYAREMREKKVFEPPKEFQNLKGQEIPTLEEDLLSQMPPVHLRKGTGRDSFRPERLPAEVQQIVSEFEDEEEYERSPDCSPIRLAVLPPRKTYQTSRNKAKDVSDPEKPVIPPGLDDLNPVEIPAALAHCSSAIRDLDFSRDSNIFTELDGLSQSFKKTSKCEEPSLETSFASPDQSLVKPFEFRDDCSLESTPKSQR